VIDYDAESSKRCLAELGHAGIREQLVRFAVWLTTSEADAEDLLSDALACVCDPAEGRPWDPVRGPFSVHMRIVLRDLARRERRSARARREVVDSRLVADLHTVDPAPTAEQAVSDARSLSRLRRLGAIVRDRLASSLRALQVFDLGAEGVDEVSEQAARLGCSPMEIRAAQQTIARHAQRVLQEDRREEARRGVRARVPERTEQGVNEP
jgi:DNA-directed RNA polymerase specialized sigma24 family protein